mmetsp:Transcript_10877/g.23197  ORF Transcript_10877/g.23197 Transcript_10877/m.23197 type:complete len:195 (+) Transcript_10877:559-1143(+)
MFCLDYAVAFFTHYSLIQAHHRMTACNTAEPDFIDQKHCVPPCSFLLNSAFGIAAGAVTASTLYPVDYVRMTTVKAGSSHFAYGVIPFMACYFGIFFTATAIEPATHGPSKDVDPTSALTRNTSPYEREAPPFVRKAGFAAVATLAASGAELPFDFSKQNVSGGMRMAAITAALRVPLGSLLLLAYDRILTHPN